MSEYIYNPKLPAVAVGHPVLKIKDADRGEIAEIKIWRAVIDLPLDLIGSGRCLEIYDGMLSVTELLDEIADPAFDYDTFAALANHVEITALAEYLTEDQGTAFPANYPTAFNFLFNFTAEEKQALAKSAWRTRTQHAMLPFWFAACQLIIIFAMRDLFLILKSKFRKLNATVAVDSRLQIPYHVLKQETWKPYLYDQFFEISTNYTATQLDNMFQHVFKSFDGYEFILPAESVKLANMLIGKFKGVMYNDQMKVVGTYPVDLMISEATYDHIVFGNNWINSIEGWLKKLHGYMTSAFLVYDKIEYNDKFYKNVFGEFKDMMSPVALTSSLLCEWDELPIPWFHIYAGLHYDNIQTRNEFIFRTWDGTYDNMVDLDDNDQSIGFDNMFTRLTAGLDRQDGDVPEYLYAIKPYGFTEEQWNLGLTYGWMFLSQYMGGNQLVSDLEINAAMSDVMQYLTYIEYFDKEKNQMVFESQGVSVPGTDTIVGYFGFTDAGSGHYILNSTFVPRALASNSYNTITDDISSHSYSSGFVVNNLDEYFTRLMHEFGYIDYECSVFQDSYFREFMYMIINPKIAPPVSNQNPELKKIENKLLNDENDKDVKNKESKPPAGPPKAEDVIKNIEKEKPKIVTKSLESDSSDKSTDEIIDKIDKDLKKKPVEKNDESKDDE